jgi:hypothetical protein
MLGLTRSVKGDTLAPRPHTMVVAHCFASFEARASRVSSRNKHVRKMQVLSAHAVKERNETRGSRRAICASTCDRIYIKSAYRDAVCHPSETMTASAKSFSGTLRKFPQLIGLSVIYILCEFC